MYQLVCSLCLCLMLSASVSAEAAKENWELEISASVQGLQAVKVNKPESPSTFSQSNSIRVPVLWTAVGVDPEERRAGEEETVV